MNADQHRRRKARKGQRVIGARRIRAETSAVMWGTEDT
jgi:hypothetical protein